MTNPLLRKRIEFHCHTTHSGDSSISPSDLVETAQNKGIERVVVTDHNTIEGALIAKELDPERIIVGEEIQTTEGELLAAFVSEQVPSGLSPQEAIAALRAQNAFISVSHPFDFPRKRAWRAGRLLEIIPLVDAIEIYNGHCLTEEPNKLARAFAREHHLLGTVGSDAHSAFELGWVEIHLPDFYNREELLTALPSIQYQGRLSPAIH